MSQQISLFIITKNEEAKIAQCILSARELVSEVIVVDGFSEDKTVQIAQSLGAKTYQRTFDGFANQKNFALRKVGTAWALNLDADEKLTPQLCEEIRRTVQNTQHAGFMISFSNYFLGKRMKYSGLNKEQHLRLVRTDKAEYEGGLVHEGLKVSGSVGCLKEHIQHYSYDSIETYFTKFNKYTSLAARQMYKNGRRFRLFSVLLTIPFEFFKRYLIKLGFLDGMRGFLWASFSAFYVFVKYTKLWALQQQDKQ